MSVLFKELLLLLVWIWLLLLFFILNYGFGNSIRLRIIRDSLIIFFNQILLICNSLCGLRESDVSFCHPLFLLWFIHLRIFKHPLNVFKWSEVPPHEKVVRVVNIYRLFGFIHMSWRLNRREGVLTVSWDEIQLQGV